MNAHARVSAILTILLSAAPVVCAQSDSGQESINNRIAHAVQWDSVWGPDATTSCPNGVKLSLSAELESSVSHNFRMEIDRHPAGMVVLLPELHRLVSLRFTPDQQLASITIAPTCETNLKDYYAKLASLRKSPPPQDPRLQQHLEKLKKDAQPTESESSKGSNHTLGILGITPFKLGTPSEPSTWPKPKVDALRSVEAAAQRSFGESCEVGSPATLMIPDFELSDPAILALIQGKTEACVLRVGFEYRKSSSDPYIAYARHSCIEDRKLVEKSRRLISQYRIETRTLTCRNSKKQR